MPKQHCAASFNTTRHIADAVGRCPSTTSRELRRNTLPHDRGYDGDLAHARARQRARRPRRSRLIDDPGLRAQVQAKLEQEWSPEQIAAHLRTAFPDRPVRSRTFSSGGGTGTIG